MEDSIEVIEERAKKQKIEKFNEKQQDYLEMKRIEHELKISQMIEKHELEMRCIIEEHNERLKSIKNNAFTSSQISSHHQSNSFDFGTL